MMMRKTMMTLLSVQAAVLAAWAGQTFTIMVDQPRQTIMHFGASDAWSMQDIGTWTDTTEQKKIADWLFSMETDENGQPRGIGLSLWRFNLGAGSAEQGDGAAINRDTRTECFLQADGSYDWSRQEGQRRFLRMAKERGVPYFLAFLNSPPVYFTQNGLATNTGRDGTLNLREDCFDDFAQFMATAMRGLEEHDGIHFDYISPVNEPDGHWNWQGPKQEGSPATNREIARLAKATSEEFQRQGVSTQIMVNESSDLRCLLGIYKTTWERGNTLRTFFSKDSTETYLGDTPLVPRLILGHSYWTNTPVRRMKNIRERLRKECRDLGIGFWQSELCIMSNDEEIGGGGGYDFTMKTALYVARIIHHDLTYADAESWSWWRACGGNYKDGLIRVWNRGHRAQDSRLLWAMGNYSRFVRPGAVRYDISGNEDPRGLMLTAFRNKDGQWVVVAINYSEKEQPLDIAFSDGSETQWKAYRTSDAEGETLKPVGHASQRGSSGQGGACNTLPPRSITTFVEVNTELPRKEAWPTTDNAELPRREAWPTTVAAEGAWCWFADPRALHYKDEKGTVDATYIGYIDVHGNVKATQYDWLRQKKTDVLVRSFFQPDDHNNPTFLVLPDGRVMIFYTRHTDEPCIWYRISEKPGDITALGEEKRLATANNTTYPSPFILSDDPQHIYLCWRGIGWHPTIARLTMPDADGNCSFDYGPYQVVQSTGARPYAKYASNGKDKIYVAYTTGHPDNEQPNWLYFNVIDINHGQGPLLRDILGRQLSVVSKGTFHVNKSEAYAAEYPATIIDRTAQTRNWVWQIALDNKREPITNNREPITNNREPITNKREPITNKRDSERPVVAYTHIDEEKTSHEYWYARWDGRQWQTSVIAPAGHAFHQNWGKTERCYSGGMAIDPDDTKQLYLSMPVVAHASQRGSSLTIADNPSVAHFDRDGVYEIWHYTLADDGSVSNKEQVTRGSAKGNARPYVIPGSANSKMRLTWMQGDYYYWMVNKWYPKGYPTAIVCDVPMLAEFDKQTSLQSIDIPLGDVREPLVLTPGKPVRLTLHPDTANYAGVLFTATLVDSQHSMVNGQRSMVNGQRSMVNGQRSMVNGQRSMVYSISPDDQRPVVTIGDRTFYSQNRLLNSDAWAQHSTGTNGDSHPTKLTSIDLTLCYDGHTLTILRDGFVDQVIDF